MGVRIWAGAVVLLAVACGSNTVVDRPEPRPGPSDPVTGPVVGAITKGATLLQLHDEGDGCLAVNVQHPDLQPTVDRHCFSEQFVDVVSITDSCGLLSDSSAPDGVCDVELPQAIYGLVTNPDVAHVCLGVIPDTGPVAGARFVDQDAEGRIFTLAKPDESVAAHLFTATGQRYGDPPLDAPSGPIYDFCEDIAPWGDPGLAYEVVFRVTVADELRADDIVVSLDAGTGAKAAGGGVFHNGSTVNLHSSTTAARPGIDVKVRQAEEVVLGERYPWPAEVTEIFDEAAGCGLINLNVRLEAEALNGRAEAVTINFNGADC